MKHKNNIKIDSDPKIKKSETKTDTFYGFIKDHIFVFDIEYVRKLHNETTTILQMEVNSK